MIPSTIGLLNAQAQQAIATGDEMNKRAAGMPASFAAANKKAIEVAMAGHPLKANDETETNLRKAKTLEAAGYILSPGETVDQGNAKLFPKITNTRDRLGLPPEIKGVSEAVSYLMKERAISQAEAQQLLRSVGRLKGGG